MLEVTGFRKQLVERLTRQELLDLIETQNPDLIKGVKRIEWVFSHKLRHLFWEKGPKIGEQITERPLTKEELALLVDEPFKLRMDLAKLGLDEDKQREIHIAKDPVLWARHILGVQPRVYQILFLRHPSVRKMLRQGRRSGKSYSLAILLLHYTYTHNNAKCIVVTPKKEQGAVVYKNLLEMIQMSQSISDSVTRKVTSPQHMIELSNGSAVKFFSSGMSSGGRADIVRGQEADILVLDELDYMHPDDIVALYAMLQRTSENQEAKILVGASTPTGQRTTPFYEWCSSERFKDFWWPAYCNPFWDQATEDEQRAQYTEMEYRHEIEADWGEDTAGVYPRLLLDRAFIEPDWKYKVAVNSARSFFVMGIDWNKVEAGCNFVVLEVCDEDYEDKRFQNKIRCVYREETDKSAEFTYLHAIERIHELHKAFKFRHIYVDYGAGSVQVELLHKYGKEHPESNLRKIVKAIDFGGRMEMMDPATNEKVKKYNKPLMVDTLLRFLENNSIFFPAHDDNLYVQLSSYVVERVNESGRVVYSAGGNTVDHAHDALILASFAIEQNYGDLLKRNFAKFGKIIDGSVFQPLAVVEFNDEKSISSDPVIVKRAMTAFPTSKTRRPIRRKTF